MEIIKKILSVIGIIALAFIVLIMIADDDTTPTQQPGSVIDEQGDSNDSIDEDEVDEEYYYTLELEDGESIAVLKPETIWGDKYKNMNEQRLNSIFTSIYNYNYKRDDVYITYIPDAEQTLKQMLKEPYAVGTTFHFVLQVTGAPVDGIVSGEVEGDDSLSNLLHIDTSYIGDEKEELMFDDIVSFDAIYAGLDEFSTPTFIGMSMEVQ